ncbi:MAG TPA: glycosyltransferase family 9 protein [Candidatus Limnocylindria bacterium]|nr:glycosyltransferase family 9 protein [Candidatus Limnocylindria bacterium]
MPPTHSTRRPLAGKRKLILRNFLCPGDLVLLTAVVRDLHRCHPGKFITDVRSSCPELWEHNPHLTPLRESDRDVEQIDCHYPLIDRCNEAPYHCIHGFADFLSERLQIPVRPTEFRGDLHLSADEQRWKSTVHELGGKDVPFWIVNSGGKFDFTIKWWHWRRYQEVVDHFAGRILFVQIGEVGHHHPPLRNVVDLRGKTDLRQLVRLVYHAQGVLCGVTALMHFAASVATRPDRPKSRAAVIIAGGREPAHWEAYPHHQFLHTIGALRCCETGGCWKARTRAIGDGEETDQPHNLCTDVVRGLPRCMDMISSRDVIRRIESYFIGGANRYLNASEQSAARRAIARSTVGPRFDTTINLGTVRAALECAAREARKLSAPPMLGRGILVLATEEADLSQALACARGLRSLGCELPIELWSAIRCDQSSRAPFRAAGVDIFDCSREAELALPITCSELRSHALTKTEKREVLLLDPDVFPLVVPDRLFSHRVFQESGALFFPRRKNVARPGVWKLCDLKLPRETASAAHLLVDRFRCWSALSLWKWISSRNYFFHGYVDGEGGAAQLAFAKLRLPSSMSRNTARWFWSTKSGEPTPPLVRERLRAATRSLHC